MIGRLGMQLSCISAACFHQIAVEGPGDKVRVRFLCLGTLGTLGSGLLFGVVDDQFPEVFAV